MKNTGRFNLFPILLILLVPIAALWQVSFFSYTMKWDMLDQFLPCRYLMSEAFANHNLPLWCPYINFGYPAYADPQGGFFYPITWVISLLFGYNVYTISVEFLFHIVVAGASFYVLLRSFKMSALTAGIIGMNYALSGAFIGNATHLSWVIALAWLPLFIYCFRKLLLQPSALSALQFGVVGYLFVCGGYPGFFIITSYFCACYAVSHLVSLFAKKKSAVLKTTIGWGFAGLVFLLVLSAGYIYVTAQTLPLIERGEGLTVEKVNTFPFTPAAMLSFLFPFTAVCRSFIVGTDLTMTNAYCGLLLLPLLFIAIFKARTDSFQKFFLAFGIICLLAATGEFTPVRSWLYYLPGMNMFRHAAR